MNSDALKKRLFYTTTSDDRSRMRAVANNLILHLHPTKVPALQLFRTLVMEFSK